MPYAYYFRGFSIKLLGIYKVSAEEFRLNHCRISIPDTMNVIKSESKLPNAPSKTRVFAKTTSKLLILLVFN